MPDINELFLELWIRWLIFYSILIIYSVILVRLVNWIINVIFSEKDSSTSIVIWLFMAAFILAAFIVWLHMQGLIKLPF